MCSYLTSNTTEEITQYFRPNVDFSKTFEKVGGLKIGINGQREKNTRIDTATDSLKQTSFYFDMAGAYFETTNSKNTLLAGRYTRRWDYNIENNEYRNSTIADELISMEIGQHPKHQD